MSATIALAQQRSFWLGDIFVEPAIRRVSRAGKQDTLEPRVMQVLVALAGARGAVIGRDELIERCWNGVVVGENAINRVISRLRRLADEFGQGFEIETVTKVGYRLIVTAPALPQPAPVPDLEAEPQAAPGPVTARRPLLRTLAGLGAAAAAGGLLYFGRHRAAADPAGEMIARGWSEARQNYRGGSRQALAYFERAVEMAPTDARAWGALALGYRNRLYEDPDSPADGYAMRTRAAAKRALELDPNDADALAANALAQPVFGRWAAAERDMRALLDRFPDHWVLRHELGALLTEVGRWTDAIAEFERALKPDPLIPTTRQRAAIALWNAGRLPDAERAVDDAFRVWPNQLWTWMIRFNFYALSGRPTEALAQADRTEDRPPDLPPPFAAMLLPAARALASRVQADRAAAIAALTTPGPGLPGFMRVMYLGGLGAVEESFRTLGAYYAASGPRAFPDRVTSVLFMLPAAALRADPRHAALLQRLGLEDYWRESRSRPDFRA